MAPLEALACGCGVAMPPLSDYPRLFKHDQIMYIQATEAGVEEAVRWGAAHPEKIVQMAVAGKATVLERASIEAAARRLSEIMGMTDGG